VRRWPLLLASSLVVIAACNLLNGASDLGIDDATCEGCADGSSDDRVDDRTAIIEDTGVDATSTDVGPTRPPYCDGIVIYARLDTSMTSVEGQTAMAADSGPSAATFVPGKFDGGALVSGVGSATYYASDASAPWSREAGTVSFWLKPTWAWPPTAERIFWKPSPDHAPGTSTSAGPNVLVMTSPPFLGVWNPEPGGVAAVNAGATFAQLTPYWKNLDWNLLVGTWRATPSQLAFVLNGGSDEAGITFRETDAAWAPESTTISYVRLSSDTFPADVVYDDLTLWDRVLTIDEIRAIYAAPISIGGACGL
jgi:hypothetical protein